MTIQLNRNALPDITSGDLSVPSKEILGLPEKVLQFGTGVLLRALPDFFIDKANKAGLFRGRIVVVKSTDQGSTDAFAKQDNLYTVCVRGLRQGQTIREQQLNASISRVLPARQEWQEILDCAANPEMQIVISNTTEVGLTYSSDSIRDTPPASFPGKLLAFLYQRFQVFSGDRNSGMVIIPTELLPDNGKILRDILIRLATENRLEETFLSWLSEANVFCNSLVDRIVPGKLPPVEQETMEKTLGYQDDLMIMCEDYRLWAIETDNEHAREILSFSAADEGVIVAPDIRVHRELKLRLLNGSHTLGCGLAHLAGFTTVKEAMRDGAFGKFVEGLMKKEIIPVITDAELTVERALLFADSVLDRFRNPFLEHRWLSITFQYSSKMRSRDLPLLKGYYRRFKQVPAAMALGWAAHLLFMKCSRNADGRYYGESAGKTYLVQDDQAPRFAGFWQEEKTVDKYLADAELWGEDLRQLPGFAETVAQMLGKLQNGSVRDLIAQVNQSA